MPVADQARPGASEHNAHGTEAVLLVLWLKLAFCPHNFLTLICDVFKTKDKKGKDLWIKRRADLGSDSNSEG